MRPGISVLVLLITFQIAIQAFGLEELEPLCPSSSRRLWFHSAAQPAFKKETGWGVYAAAEIATGTVVAKIPLDKCLYRATFQCKNEISCKIIEDIRSRLSQRSSDADEIALAAYLALHQDDAYSKAVSKVASLVRVSFPDDVIDRVVQPLLPDLARRLRTMKVLHEEAMKYLAPMNISLEEFENAVFAVTSRSFYLKTTPTSRDVIMVPCGDLFNHEDGPQPVGYMVEGSDLVFRTRRDYERGEELKISYGFKSAESLFFQYGFFIPGSSINYVHISLSNSTYWGENHDELTKKFLLDKLGDKGTIKVAATGVMGLGLALLRSLALSRDEMSAYTLANILGLGHVAPSEESEARAAAILSMSVYDEILKYREVFEANEGLLKQHKMLHELLLVQLRLLAGMWRQFNKD